MPHGAAWLRYDPWQQRLPREPHEEGCQRSVGVPCKYPIRRLHLVRSKKPGARAVIEPEPLKSSAVRCNYVGCYWSRLQTDPVIFLCLAIVRCPLLKCGIQPEY